MMSRLKQFLFLFFLIFMALAYLAAQAKLIEQGFTVDVKRTVVEQLVAERDRLEMEVAHASSLERIEEIATKSLGMVPPGETIYLASGGSTVSAGERDMQLAQALSDGERGR